MLSSTIIRSSALRSASRVASSSKSKLLAVPNTKSALQHFHSLKQDHEVLSVSSSEALSADRDSRVLMAEPMPCVAVAYDYDYDEHDDEGDSISNDGKHMMTIGTTNFTKPSPATHRILSSLQHNNTTRKVSGGGGPPSRGGGGSGRHKCPKCGMSMTFKHSDFEGKKVYATSISIVKNRILQMTDSDTMDELQICPTPHLTKLHAILVFNACPYIVENTFYCATCSGWFLVNNANEGELPATGKSASGISAMAAGGGTRTSQGVYGAFRDDSKHDQDRSVGSDGEKKVPSPKVLMQHVSLFNADKIHFAETYTRCHVLVVINLNAINLHQSHSPFLFGCFPSFVDT